MEIIAHLHLLLSRSVSQITWYLHRSCWFKFRHTTHNPSLVEASPFVQPCHSWVTIYSCCSCEINCPPSHTHPHPHPHTHAYGYAPCLLRTLWLCNHQTVHNTGKDRTEVQSSTRAVERAQVPWEPFLKLKMMVTGMLPLILHPWGGLVTQAQILNWAHFKVQWNLKVAFIGITW